MRDFSIPVHEYSTIYRILCNSFAFFFYIWGLICGMHRGRSEFIPVYNHAALIAIIVAARAEVRAVPTDEKRHLQQCLRPQFGEARAGEAYGVGERDRVGEVEPADVVGHSDVGALFVGGIEAQQMDAIFRKQKFDFVYHLAAEYGRWNGEDHYANLWRTNVIGTKNMLRLQEIHRFRMIFFKP